MSVAAPCTVVVVSLVRSDSAWDQASGRPGRHRRAVSLGGIGLRSKVGTLCSVTVSRFAVGGFAVGGFEVWTGVRALATV